jgi:hypothetical protein
MNKYRAVKGNIFFVFSYGFMGFGFFGLKTTEIRHVQGA